MDSNFIDQARSIAPNLFKQIDTDSADPWNFIYCQILSLQTKSHLNPISDHTIYTDIEIKKINNKSPDMRIYVSKKCKIDGLNINTGSRGRIFIGENANVRNLTINSPKTDATLIIGPNVDISNSIIQYSGSKNFAILCSSSTMTKANFYIGEEGSYVLVGDDCMFSNDVSMRTSDSHGIYDKETRQRLNPPAPIILANHVWVGRHACLNKGTWVGRDTVIGQHSVTSGVLEPEAIYAGVPAKLLRTGVVWDRKIATNLDEAQIILPIQTRHKNHLNSIERLDSLRTLPLDDLELTSAVSIILASRRSPSGLTGIQQEAAKLASAMTQAG